MPALIHDARGNTTGIGTAAYTYTSENHLFTGPAASLYYAPSGRLLFSSTGIRFDHAGSQLVTERDGSKAIERCTIYMGGMFGRGIQLVHGETLESGSANEMLNVDADEQACFIRTMGFGIGGAKPKLTFEGAAEHLWAILIRPLQHG